MCKVVKNLIDVVCLHEQARLRARENDSGRLNSTTLEDSPTDTETNLKPLGRSSADEPQIGHEARGDTVKPTATESHPACEGQDHAASLGTEASSKEVLADGTPHESVGPVKSKTKHEANKNRSKESKSQEDVDPDQARLQRLCRVSLCGRAKLTTSP